MRKRMIAVLPAALLVVLCTLSAATEMITCAQCGMIADPASKFTSRIVGGEKVLYFCDIGDLFAYLTRKGAPDARAEVKDYKTGEWIDAHGAFYVHSGEKFKSPMGWGIAAFKDGKAAAAYGGTMDYNGALKAVQ